jgi:predicted N-formylglutamate amidohydrolase
VTLGLLAPGDPPPFEVTPGGAGSPYMVLCDHAGRQLPRVLGSLGLPAPELERHIAWDIGAAALSRQLAVTTRNRQQAMRRKLWLSG